jgi:alpha-galactosidase
MILYVGNGDVWSRDHAYTAMDDWSWAPEIGAASWRTSTDLSAPNGITWGTLLRNIDADAAHPGAAGHGHWNDPDYLAPTYLPPGEARAQFTMWIILAAPLMVSADISTLPQSTIAMLTNRQAIAISQDPLGRQGVAIARRAQVQLWLKPLADGSKALAVLNRGPRRGSITITGPMLGLARGELRVLHVWGNWTSRTKTIHASVAGRSALLLRVWPARATGKR